jgi:thioredoxin 1
MASENLVVLTDANFQDEVLQSSIPVLVDFWAEWCGPCRAVAPFIEELAGDFAGKAKVGKVDTDSNRDTALKFGISAIPTVMIFKDGQVVKRFVGVQSKREYAAALNAAMK